MISSEQNSILRPPNLRRGKGETSRDRPKSVPYLRLESIKRTSKCQSILLSCTVSEQPKRWTELVRQGKPLRFSSIVSQIVKILEGDPLWKIFFSKKVSQSRKKNWKGDTLVSPDLVCCAEKRKSLIDSLSLTPLN